MRVSNPGSASGSVTHGSLGQGNPLQLGICTQCYLFLAHAQRLPLPPSTASSEEQRGALPVAYGHRSSSERRGAHLVPVTAAERSRETWVNKPIRERLLPGADGRDARFESSPGPCKL